VSFESGNKKKKRRSSRAAGSGAAQAGDWESRVLAKIANRVEAVVPARTDTQQDGSRYGWEDRSLNHLADHVRRKRKR